MNKGWSETESFCLQRKTSKNTHVFFFSETSLYSRALLSCIINIPAVYFQFATHRPLCSATELQRWPDFISGAHSNTCRLEVQFISISGTAYNYQSVCAAFVVPSGYEPQKSGLVLNESPRKKRNQTKPGVSVSTTSFCLWPGTQMVRVYTLQHNAFSLYTVLFDMMCGSLWKAVTKVHWQTPQPVFRLKTRGHNSVIVFCLWVQSDSGW